MLQLRPIRLDPTEVTVLSTLQTRVDGGNDFKTKVELAQSLWKTKGGLHNSIAFSRIREQLKDMCIGIEVCNYCEDNEANDIEHIYPKSFFPQKTFVWENYLLVCKQCNTGYKLDKCYVLDAEGNLCPTERGNEPAHTVGAFINPRTENPNTFLWLNLRTMTYVVLDDLSLAEKNKAEKTLEILALNTRPYLIEGRKVFYDKYFDKLDRLRRIIEATTLDDIADALNPQEDELLDRTMPIESIKAEKKACVEAYIKRLKHPSVWHAIKTQSHRNNPKWQRIFTTIPEALNW